MITKVELESEIQTGGTWTSMARKFNCSVSTVKHWLKKHSLRTNFSVKKYAGLITRDNERARRLSVLGVKRRRDKLRVMSITYLGSKCQRSGCGYSRFSGALEFHHRDPRDKDPSLVLRGTTNSWVKMRDELDKCVLLCSNCHREVHHEMRMASFSLEKFLSGNEFVDNHLGYFNGEALLAGESTPKEILLKPCKYCGESMRDTGLQYCSIECHRAARRVANPLPDRRELTGKSVQYVIERYKVHHKVADRWFRESYIQPINHWEYKRLSSNIVFRLNEAAIIFSIKLESILLS